MRQHYKITRIKIYALLSFLAATSVQAAAPLWTLTPAYGSNPTQVVPKNSTATVSYEVQNQSRKFKNVVLLPTAGIQQTSPCRMAPKGQPGSSCILTLLITGNDLPQGGIHGGPALCHANEDGTPNRTQCYQPSEEDQLNVSRATSTQQATLNLNPNNLSFTANTTSNPVTLTNTSTSVTATGLSITPSSNLIVTNNNCNNTLLPQESCTFSLTSSVASTDNTVTAKGSNTPIVQLTASVTPTFVLTAVGSYLGGGQALPVSYYSLDNGTTWNISTTQPPPQVSNNQNLMEVSCSNTGYCAAVGYYAAGKWVPFSYTSNDNGVTWHVSMTPPPAPGGNSAFLNSVSCDNFNHCVAVGVYMPLVTLYPVSYTSSDNGNNWVLSTALPPIQGSSNNLIRGVSCNDAGYCAVVGSYVDGALDLPLIFFSTDHGATWGLSTVAAQGSYNVLEGVSCNSGGHCVAVGFYDNGVRSLPLSYTSTDHGATWSVSSTPPPAQGSSNDRLTSVSCDNAGHCSAVGVYTIGGRTVPLSYTSSDNGISWIPSSTFPPAQGNGNNQLQSVFCDNFGHCSAVGYYINGGQTLPASYISIDRGANWTLSTTQPPLLGDAVYLYSVGG